MIIFDYFVYIAYIFPKEKFNIAHDDALRGSVGLLAVYIAIFTMGIVAFIGILADNPIINAIVNIDPIFFVLFIFICFFLFRIRYYKTIKDLDNKIKEYDQHKSNKKMRRIIYFILIAVPVFSFVAYRIYYTQQA